MRTGLPDITRRLNTVVIDEIGHTLTGQQIRRSLDLEVDMRFAGISGDSNLRQNLAAPHMVPNLYARAAWLQVQVGSELLSAQIKHNMVTEYGVGCHVYSGSEFPIVSWHIVRKTIPHRHHGAICDSQYGFSIGVVRAFIACVSRERLPV